MGKRFFAYYKKARAIIGQFVFGLLAIASFYIIFYSRDYRDWFVLWIQIIFIGIDIYISFVKPENRDGLDVIHIGYEGVRKRSWFKTKMINWDDIDQIYIREQGKPYFVLWKEKFKIRNDLVINGKLREDGTYEEICIESREDIIQCISCFFELPNDLKDNVTVG